MSNEILRTYGPNQKWTEFVSGLSMDNYTLAVSIWTNAKAARAKLGREQKISSNVTTLDQPIWGSTNQAISKWVNGVVYYGSKQKLVIKFTSILNAETNLIGLMDYVSFAWGSFRGNPINGYVVDIELNLSSATINFTLLCLGDFSSLPLILTEEGEAVELETGELIELEDISQASKKISEMNEISAESAEASGAYIATAISRLSNYKVSLTSIYSWIVNPINQLINSLYNSIANKVDKIETNLQTMSSALKMPFLSLYSQTSAPSTINSSSLWFNSLINRLVLHTKEVALIEDTYNLGIVTNPTITKGSNGSITISNDGEYIVCENADYSGRKIKVSNPNGITLNLPLDGSERIIAYAYGTGYVALERDYANWANGLIVPIGIFWFDCERIHSSIFTNLSYGQSEKLVVKEALTRFYERVDNSGLIITISGLVPSISSALVYNGSYIENVLAFDGSTDSLYKRIISNGVWSESVVSGIDTTIYNPSTGEESLPSGKYTWFYVYRSIGDDKEAFIVYGNEYFSDRQKAIEGARLPSNLSDMLKRHCILVGLGIFLQNDLTILTKNYFSSFDNSLGLNASLSNHNDLEGLDGGDPSNNFYGHVSALVLSILTKMNSPLGVPVLTDGGYLHESQNAATLTDAEAGTTLPAAGVTTMVRNLLQSVRNNLKYLFASVSSLSTEVSTILSNVSLLFTTKVDSLYTYETPAVPSHGVGTCYKVFHVSMNSEKQEVIRLEIQRYHSSNIDVVLSQTIQCNVTLSEGIRDISSFVCGDSGSSRLMDSSWYPIDLGIWKNASGSFDIGLLLSGSYGANDKFKIKLLAYTHSDTVFSSSEQVEWESTNYPNTSFVVNAGGSSGRGVMYTNVGNVPKRVATVDEIPSSMAHNDLVNIDGGDPSNDYYGHVTEAQNSLLTNAGLANGVAVLDSNGYLPESQNVAILTDAEASTTLPTAGTTTLVKTLLQSVRNNLKSLFASVSSLTTAVSGCVVKAGTAQQTITRTTEAVGVLGIGVAGEAVPRVNFLANGRINYSANGSTVLRTSNCADLDNLTGTTWENCAGESSSATEGIFAEIELTGTSTSESNYLLQVTTVGSNNTTNQGTYLIQIVLKRQGTTLRSPIVSVLATGNNYNARPLLYYWNTTTSILYLACYKPAYATVAVRALLKPRAGTVLTVYSTLSTPSAFENFGKAPCQMNLNQVLVTKSSTSNLILTTANFVNITAAGGTLYLPVGRYLTEGDEITLLNYSGSSQTVMSTINNIQYKSTLGTSFSFVNSSQCRLKLLNDVWYYIGT